jgi:hypothetical protein
LRERFGHLLENPRANLISKFQSIEKSLNDVEAPKEVNLKKERSEDAAAPYTDSAYQLPHLRDLQASRDQPEGSRRTGLKRNIPISQRSRQGPSAFRHLVPLHQRIPLPRDFEHLDQVFDALESTVMYQRGRNENAIFIKLQKTVEGVCNRSFNLAHVQQIQYLFPEAYQLEAVKVTHLGVRTESISFDFNISWSKKRKLDDMLSPSKSGSPGVASPKKSLTPTKPMHPGTFESPRSTVKSEVPVAEMDSISKAAFAAVEIPKRKLEFRRRLIQFVETKHNSFLKSHNIDWNPMEAKTHWHPEFPLESVTLPGAHLPSYSTLDQRKFLIPTAASIRAAKMKVKAEEQNESETANEVKDDRPSLHDRQRSLLDRIKNKEKRQKEDQLLGLTPAQLKKKTMLSRLHFISDTLQWYVPCPCPSR